MSLDTQPHQGSFVEDFQSRLTVTTAGWWATLRIGPYNMVYLWKNAVEKARHRLTTILDKVRRDP